MIKKWIIFLICVVLAVCLCGCEGYRETENRYIVTALGFDGGENGSINISVEVVSSGGSEVSNEPYSEILKGNGESPGNAIFVLNNEISKHLMFDHCSAIIIGKTVNLNQLKEIFDYIKNEKELNYGVYLTTTENAEKLLTKSKSISVARGFDISGNIKETTKEIGINFRNKFYEIYKSFYSGDIYSFPFLKEDNEKIVIFGEEIFKDGKKKALLTGEESLIYSIVESRNSGGKIYFGKEFAEIKTLKSDTKETGENTITFRFKNQSKYFTKEFEAEAQNFIDRYGKMLNLKTKKIKVAKGQQG